MQQLTVTALLDMTARRSGVFLTEAELIQEHQKIIIDIPADAKVATTPAARKELSQSRNRRWRWSQGGVLFVIRFADAVVIPMRLRDVNAPSWGGHYTAASGLAGMPDEWLEPSKVALREGCEEFIIATPDGIAVPWFEDASLDSITCGAVATSERLVRCEPKLPDIFRARHLVKQNAKLRHTLHEREIVVRLDGKECSSTRMYPILDPGTRGIDAMYIVDLDLRTFDLDTVSIFCGEDANGRSLDSEMAYLELDGDMRPKGIVRSFKTGRPIESHGGFAKMTPVLKEMIEKL